MKFVNFLCVIFMVLATSLPSFARLNGEETFVEVNQGQQQSWRINSCDRSPPLPADRYMACVENLGFQIFSERQMHLKAHPTLAQADCWRLINEQEFMACLDEYIRASASPDDGDQPTAPARYAEAQERSEI